MNTELQMAYDNIMQAVCAEDIFGIIEGEKKAITDVIKRIYFRISKIVHPDRYNSDVNKREMADEAFRRLNEFYEAAQNKIDNGEYGKCLDEEVAEDSGFVIKTLKREYIISSTLAEGDLSTVYGGDCAGGDDFAGKIAVKVFEDAKDSDLAQNEVKILKIFQAEPSNQSKHLPVFLDRFKTTDDQQGTILRYIDGYDLYSVREKYKNGIDRKHMVWMLNRGLSVLGYVHSKGVTHNNIEPGHFMVRPKDHNAWIIDWCYAAANSSRSGDGFKVYNDDFSAPEVKDKKPPLPAADLYSLGKCMIFALGGDIKTNEMPDIVEDKLQRFIKFFVRESPLQRAQDAWEMHEKLNELVVELWGLKKFLEFKM